VVDVAAVAGQFGQRLHDAGLPVSPDASGRWAAALVLAPPATVTELYWLARVTLVSEHAHLAIFDRTFGEVFGGSEGGDPADWRGQERGTATNRAAAPGQAARPGPGASVGSVPGWHEGIPRVIPPSTDDAPGGDTGPGLEALLAAASPEERLRTRDFSSLSEAELAVVRTLMAQMTLSAPLRRGRRKTPAPTGRHVDVRATLRQARRTGGDPAELIRRRRRLRPRRLVFICDVSGSMQPYARAYLQLLMSGVGGANAEAFVFATRLTRLTPSLRSASPDVALARAGRAAPDWSGGTRLGEAVRSFNDRYGRRGLARGAVVVILSDGWDCGDAALLAREMGRLRRLAHRVIWVNPRRAAPGYRPLTSGIIAARPHVDDMRSGHSVQALQELLAAIHEDRWAQPRSMPSIYGHRPEPGGP
jgi:uncharacterized protein with von Willebrand factor type A (vWA) domain